VAGVAHHDGRRSAQQLLLVQIAEIEAARGDAATEVAQYGHDRVGIIAGDVGLGTQDHDSHRPTFWLE
jgi:hypothetical protein